MIAFGLVALILANSNPTPSPVRRSIGVIFYEVKPQPLRSQAGVAVRFVLPDSPAATAGIRRGDIVAKVDNRSIDTREDAVAAISSSKGECVRLTIDRMREPRSSPCCTTPAVEDGCNSVCVREHQHVGTDRHLHHQWRH